MEQSVTQNAVGDSAKASAWFTKEEFYWRSLASCIWLLILLPVVLVVFILVVNFSLFAPVVWITEFTSFSLSFSAIGYCISLQVCSVLILVSQARALSVSKANHPTNFKLFLHMMRPKQLMSVVSILITSFLSSLILMKFYVHNDEEQSKSVTNSEQNSFMLLYSLALGVCLSITYYKNSEYVLRFPVIQQKRFFQAKKVIYPCLQDSVMLSLKILRFYYPLYLSIGVVPQSLIFVLFGYEMESFSVLSTFWNLFNISLFWSCLCLSVAIVFLFKISNHLVQICNSQHYIFPIITTLTEHDGKTLAEAMKSDDPLLQHLAFFDYVTISKHTGQRRLQLYQLSTPGSQPHVWNKTTAECFRLLESLRSKLVSAYEYKQHSKLRMSSLPAATVGVGHLFSPRSEEQASFTDIRGKQMNSPGRTIGNFIHTSTHVIEKEDTCKNNDQLNVFEHLQLSLWCIEGLCNLVAASLKEDQYGVVQKKLPDILSELIVLLEICEKYMKMSVMPSTLSSSIHMEEDQRNAWNASSLKLALKTGLYTITSAFGYHISAIRLPPDHKKRLHAFIEFAE